jgi:hypothetical protein
MQAKLVALLFSAFAPVALAQTQAQTPPPATQSPKSWRPVAYADLQLPSAATQSFADIWADAIAANNAAYLKRGDARFQVGNAPVTESHAVVRSPSRTAVVSVLNTATGCKTIASDASGHATLKRCPMRVAAFGGARNLVGDAGEGCFIEYAPPANASLDPSRNVAVSSYDPASRTIRVGVVFARKIVDDCQINVSVPPPQ